MSVAKKVTKQELRTPDAFMKAGTEAREWVQARERLVVLAIVVVLLAGSGVALANYLSDRGEQRAAQELGLAMKVVTRPVSAEPSPKGLVEGEEPPFKSEKEKDEAITQAMEAFEAGHRASKATVTADLILAQAQLRLGRFDEAQKGFERYLKTAPVSEPLRMAALEGQGYAFEGKGQLDLALRAFDDLSHEDKTEFLAGMGMYHHARILLLQGKKQEAAQGFADVQAKFDKTAAARLAADRLALLAAEGIRPPPSAAPVPAAAPNVLK